MKIVTIHKAKTTLSQLISEAEAGAEIVLARGKEPVVKLVPVAKRGKRKFGAFKGKIRIGPEFFEPMKQALCRESFKTRSIGCSSCKPCSKA